MRRRGRHGLRLGKSSGFLYSIWCEGTLRSYRPRAERFPSQADSWSAGTLGRWRWAPAAGILGSSARSSRPCAPGGGTPALSFHTHNTQPTALDAVLGSDPFRRGPAKVALLPSVKDICADAEDGSAYGCIGGRGSDGTGLLWCFRSLVDADPRERQTAEREVQDIQERLREALKNEAREERRTMLLAILQDYLDRVRSPCLELRLSGL